MHEETTIRWCIAALFWLLALVVFGFNIRRQKINQAYYDTGSDQRMSGIVFLFSIFTWIGVAASPLSLNGFWLLILVFELPAIANFIEEPDTSSSEPVKAMNDQDKCEKKIQG